MNEEEKEQLRLLLKAQFGVLYRVEQIWQALDARDIMRAVKVLESFDELTSKAGNSIMNFMSEEEKERVWKEISEEIGEPILGVGFETFMSFKLK